MKALELIVDDEEVVSELAEVRGLLVTFRARRAELRAQLEGESWPQLHISIHALML